MGKRQQVVLALAAWLFSLLPESGGPLLVSAILGLSVLGQVVFPLMAIAMAIVFGPERNGYIDVTQVPGWRTLRVAWLTSFLTMVCCWIILLICFAK